MLQKANYQRSRILLEVNDVALYPTIQRNPVINPCSIFLYCAHAQLSSKYLFSSSIIINNPCLQSSLYSVSKSSLLFLVQIQNLDITQGDIKIGIFLLQPLQCLHYKHVTPYLASFLQSLFLSETLETKKSFMLPAQHTCLPPSFPLHLISAT